MMRPICLLPLLALLAPVSVLAAPGDIYTVANAATLRSGPGGSFPEVGTTNARNPIPLVEISRQGGWIETDRGWVWGPLVCLANRGPADGAATAEPSNDGTCGASPNFAGGSDTGNGSNPNRMIVAVDASYLRQAPKPDAKSEFRLGVGAEVVVSKTEGDWVRVSLGDVTGWMMRSNLKAADATDVAAAPTPRKSLLGGGPKRPVDPSVTLVGF